MGFLKLVGFMGFLKLVGFKEHIIRLVMLIILIKLMDHINTMVIALM